MKKYRAIFIGAGVLILALLFYGFGVQKTIDDILAMGWRFWIIVGIFLFNNIFMTIGWKVLINHPVRPSYYVQLFLARVAGDSTSSVNAMASAAGEALKAIYIKDVIPFQTGLASVVLDRTVHILSNVLMMLTGIFISFFVLNIPLWISVGTLAAFMLLLYTMMVVLNKQRQGFVRYLLTRVPGRWLDRFMTDKRWEKVDTLDGEIAFVFSSRETMKSFYYSLAIHYLSGFFFQAWRYTSSSSSRATRSPSCTPCSCTSSACFSPASSSSCRRTWAPARAPFRWRCASSATTPPSA